MGRRLMGRVVYPGGVMFCNMTLSLSLPTCFWVSPFVWAASWRTNLRKASHEEGGRTDEKWGTGGGTSDF